MKKILSRSIIAMVLIILLSGCALIKKPGVGTSNLEQTIKVRITTANDLNKNPNGSSSPVVLIIYQIKSNLTFNTTDFFSLYKNSKATLGDDLISGEPFVVLPNKTQDVPVKINSGTQYLGVIAAFQDINNAKWRQSIQLNKTTKNLTIDLENSNLTVEEEKNDNTK